MGGAAVSSDPGREIRLALVLNGGVSLAVWMGGVTHEIDDLRRSSWQFRGQTVPPCSASHEVYVGLLEALGTGLRVDVIAGSSAGGINGAALGAAIGAGRPLRVSGDRPLRDLWISVGDFARLLRPVTDSHPASLLRGDDYMLPQMQKAFRAILGTQPPPGLPDPPGVADGADAIGAAILQERRDATTIRLFVTSTAFRANERDFTDALGTPFSILDNRLRFRIVRDRWLPRDDFARSTTELGDLFGLAARASASFPVAFEPTLLSTGSIPKDMLVLDRDTYAMDGGVLDNEPFDPVLDQISQMPAEDGVTRYLAYIVPYSNSSRPAAGPAVDPNVRDVLLNVAGLPRDEGIDRDFDRIVNLGVLTGTRADTSVRLLDGDGDLDEDAAETGDLLRRLAERLGDLQRSRRSVAARAEIERRADAPGAGLGPNGDVESIFQRFPHQRATSTDLPGEAGEASGWPHGFAAAERIAQRALSVLRRWLSGDRRPAAASVADITSARALVSRAIGEIRIMGTEYTERLRDDPSSANADALYRTEYADPLQSVMDSVAGELERIRPSSGETWLDRLWYMELLSQSLPSSLARPVPPFNFVRMSADCANAVGLDDMDSPSAKLSGLQVGHFGGFLKRSWRANDWIWGRLDGAWHLVHLLLDETRLLEDEPSQRARLADELAPLAFPDDPALLPTLIRLWDRSLPESAGDVARAQFAQAFNEGSIAERCAPAIAARAQLAILVEELPTLWREAAADRKSGWRRDIPETLPKPEPVPPAAALDQFADWASATRKVSDEQSTSALARLVAQAAVVLSTLLSTNAGIPRPLRAPFVWMRGVALGGYLFVRSWFSKPIGGLAVAALLVAAAILTVLVSSAFAAVVVPVAIGSVVVASALLLGSGPTWFRYLCTGVGVGAALVACAFAYHHSGRSYHVDTWIALVVAGAVGFGIGCLAAVSSRARLPVFLLGLAVVCGALIYVYGGGGSHDNWLVRLLVLATALPFAFGIPALGRALEDSKRKDAQAAAADQEPAANAG
jgi:predicted acylesterase/phospholipase RssA